MRGASTFILLASTGLFAVLMSSNMAAKFPPGMASSQQTGDSGNPSDNAPPDQPRGSAEDVPPSGKDAFVVVMTFPPVVKWRYNIETRTLSNLENTARAPIVPARKKPDDGRRTPDLQNKPEPLTPVPATGPKIDLDPTKRLPGLKL